MLHAQQDGHSKDKTDIETRNGCDVEQLGGQPFPPRDSHKTEWRKRCDLWKIGKKKDEHQGNQQNRCGIAEGPQKRLYCLHRSAVPGDQLCDAGA